MRIPSGVTDQYIYFVAVDSTDLKTREAGLTTFTVYRSRNGGAAAAYTTPTVAELSAANMPGVYSLLLDEDMTIDSGDQSQEMVLHITQASMAPVTRVIEIYRPSVTAGETLTVASGAAGTVNALGTQAKADVNAEMVYTLNFYTYAEIGQEAPAATQSLRKMIAFLYKAWRNKKTQTSTLYQLYGDDAVTVHQKATTS